jgi:hypothetical protein
MSSDRRDGLLTDKDKEWLSGDSGSHDQKHALRVAMAKLMDDMEFLFQQDLEDIPEPSTESLSELLTHIDSNEESDGDSNEESDSDSDEESDSDSDEESDSDSDEESDDDSDEESDDGEAYPDLDREDCAKYLIALAYIITNEPIDYTEIAEDIILHPRDESKSPHESDRAVGSPMIASQPIDGLLSFRRALTSGIKLGKSRVESDNQETIPNTVLVDANTRLYKEPTKERLEPDSGVFDPDVSGFDTDDWADAVAKWVDAGHPDDDSADVSRSTAKQEMINEIHGNVLVRLSERRHISGEPINPNKLPDY